MLTGATEWDPVVEDRLSQTKENVSAESQFGTHAIAGNGGSTRSDVDLIASLAVGSGRLSLPKHVIVIPNVSKNIQTVQRFRVSASEIS